jgi:DNA-binding MurR/RpiR family transcriptional regulator
MGKKLLALLKEKAEELTPNQKKIADYLFSNADKAAFMTITELSRNAAVSESTVTRFCTALGYRKYNELQKELQRNIQKKYSSIDRFKLIENKKTSSNKSNIQKIFQTELNVINELYESLNINTFKNIVNLLFEKDQVIIAGIEASSCLAQHIACNLRKIRKNVFLYTEINDKAYNQMEIFNTDCVALLFALPRYPKRIVDYYKALLANNIPVISITDGITSPIASSSIEEIFIPIEKVNFIDQLSAVMALLNAISIEVAKSNPEKTKKHLEDFEKISELNSTFIKA